MVYRKPPKVPPSEGFQVLDWWQTMGCLIPKLTRIACRALAVPAGGCDVERSFSSLKWVKDENKKGMHEDTHIAATLLHFNGVVPIE